jgi:hypothetical protein
VSGNIDSAFRHLAAGRISGAEYQHSCF